jgi:hypothetical protein
MKLTNTKNQVKTIGKDASSLVKSIFKLPSAFVADCRQHREAMKLGYELLAQQEAEQQPSTEQ